MHWCLGMYASGSTWLFNAVLDVAKALEPDRRIEGSYIGYNGPLPSLLACDTLAIIKTHDVDAETLQGLQDSAKVIWVSIRDPRDCVSSLMEYQGYSFAEACDLVVLTARICALLADDPRSHVLRYEDGFIDDQGTLDRIASSFGRTLREVDVASIFVASRRSAVEAYIRQIPSLRTAVWPDPGHVVDTATQWHSHHANRTGEIGRWKRFLTNEQVGTFEPSLGDWMERFHYHKADLG